MVLLQLLVVFVSDVDGSSCCTDTVGCIGICCVAVDCGVVICVVVC